MEVGAIKQAYNNEVILLKKKLNQAKIQIIHKLTRKAKAFTEKKAPEKLKEKLKRKAESAINEVLIIKKIQAKELAKFIITHSGNLNDYLNKPKVDNDKACARLLLHKTLQDKYKFIRDRFSGIHIEDLLMSREERRRIKKEAREKQKKKQGNENVKNNNTKNEWDVEDIQINGISKNRNKVESFRNEKVASDNESIENESDLADNDKKLEMYGDEDIDESENNSDEAETEHEVDDVNEAADTVGKFVKLNPVIGNKPPKANKKTTVKKPKNNKSKNFSEQEIDDGNEAVGAKGKYVKLNQVEENKQNPKETSLEVKPNISKTNKKNIEKKPNNKNKNFNEKILLRKFKKDTNETSLQEKKIVDPFFITSTGENYMSLVEPREPDEIKPVHKNGNRKLRRAIMFGRVPNIKPRQDNKYERQNDSHRGTHPFKRKFNNRNENDDSISFKNRNAFRVPDKSEKEIESEKLHPSWEAKKKKSGILPFQGKKIVFDDIHDSISIKNSNASRASNNSQKETKSEKLHPSWEAKKKQSSILPFQGKKMIFDDN